MTFLERFWARVEKTDGCWLWTGAATNTYGHCQVDRDGRLVYVHRVSYELIVGPIPEGLVLDHLCRQPRCVNPDHLEPVTLGENSRRGMLAREPKTHCKRGHLLSGDNLRIEPNGQYMSRRCRECRRLAGNKTGRRRDERFTHCRRGHELTDDNVYIHPDGGRECLTCIRLRARNRRNAAGVAKALGGAA